MNAPIGMNIPAMNAWPGPMNTMDKKERRDFQMHILLMDVLMIRFIQRVF